MTTCSDCAVIWDVDGTLVDTAELHFQAWLEVARELSMPFTRADFADTFGRRNPEIIQELFGAQFTDREVADLGAHKEELYRATVRRQGISLLPGVQALLDDLRAGGFRQAVGSSAPRGNLDLILEALQVGDYFGAVVAMEDTQRGKPDPQVFLVAAEKLGMAPARCLVLEDAPAGVQAARAGGMRCIAVRFVGHHDEDRLRAAGADRVVLTLEEVSARDVRRFLGC